MVYKIRGGGRAGWVMCTGGKWPGGNLTGGKEAGGGGEVRWESAGGGGAWYHSLISGTGSFICPVTQTWLDIPRPLFTSHGPLGESAVTRQIRKAPCRSTQSNTPTTRPTITAPSRRINYRPTPGPQRGGGDLRNRPTTCRPSPGALIEKRTIEKR